MEKYIFHFLLFIIPITAYNQCYPDSLSFLPSQQEIENVKTEWANRDHNVYNWQIVNNLIIDDSRIIIASHEIGGYIHYGLIRLPADSTLLECKLPVLLYLHGGINGLWLNKINALDNFFPSSLLRDSMILVAPSFRSELLSLDTNTVYYSIGPYSELDADADDAIIFLKGVIQNFPIADTTRISAIGFSRGGNVALKVGIRTSYIKGMNVFFAATNFFDPIIQQDAKYSFSNYSIPEYFISNNLINESLSPYCSNSISLEQARIKELSFSVAYFAENLPPANIFHGTNDNTVPVSQSYFLDSVVNSINPINDFHFYEFPNGGHTAGSLTGFEPYALEMIKNTIKPSLFLSNDSLTSKGRAPAYQWYLDNLPVPGETGKSILPATQGIYKVEFITGVSCSYFSKEFNWIITNEEPVNINRFQLSYNQESNSIYSNCISVINDCEIIITDSKGSVLFNKTGDINFPFSLNNICSQPGIYFLLIENSSGFISINFAVLE